MIFKSKVKSQNFRREGEHGTWYIPEISDKEEKREASPLYLRLLQGPQLKQKKNQEAGSETLVERDGDPGKVQTKTVMTEGGRQRSKQRGQKQQEGKGGRQF